MTGAIVIITDVDRVKRAEEALRDSETELRQSRALLATTFEQMPLAIGVTDVKGRFLLKNALLSRFARDVIPGMDDETFDRWRSVDAGGKRLERTDYPAMRALRGEAHAAMEALYRDPDGREIWTHVTATPLRDEQGAVTGAILMVADIDLAKRAEIALRESQQRIQLATEATEVGIWEWNVQTGVTVWDAQMFRLHGLPPTEGGLADYAAWADCVLPEDLPAASGGDVPVPAQGRRRPPFPAPDQTQERWRNPRHRGRGDAARRPAWPDAMGGRRGSRHHRTGARRTSPARQRGSGCASP